jgi:hypothetical protein
MNKSLKFTAAAIAAAKKKY